MKHTTTRREILAASLSGLFAGGSLKAEIPPKKALNSFTEAPIDWISCRRARTIHSFGAVAISLSGPSAYVVASVSEKGMIFIEPYYWIPESHPLSKQPKQIGVRRTRGAFCDPEAILAEIIVLRRRFKTEKIAFDPCSTTLMAEKLTDSGIVMVEYSGAKVRSAGGCFLRAIKKNWVRHPDSPILNAEILERLPDGNHNPSNCGAWATIMAVDLTVRWIPDLRRNLYGA